MKNETTPLTTVAVDPLVMPCDALCPKCGSKDIRRLFFAKGQKIENKKYNEPPCEWTTGQCYYFEAIRDLIKHHCRCCQFGWVAKPLSKRHNGLVSCEPQETKEAPL